MLAVAAFLVSVTFAGARHLLGQNICCGRISVATDILKSKVLIIATLKNIAL